MTGTGTAPCPNARCTMRTYLNALGQLVHCDGLRDLRKCYPVGHLDDYAKRITS